MSTIKGYYLQITIVLPPIRIGLAKKVALFAVNDCPIYAELF